VREDPGSPPPPPPHGKNIDIHDPDWSVDDNSDDVGDAYGELWLAQRDEAIWFSGDYLAHKNFDD
jgi:hypothetical protein